uniref:Oxidoreductase n=1 Tax=Globodera pallida TaxID=36090 RepID=A0A183CST0_GLOPA
MCPYPDISADPDARAHQGWTSPVPESASRVSVIFLEMPVTASASYVMTPLKNGVIGVIGVGVSVSVTG